MPSDVATACHAFSSGAFIIIVFRISVKASGFCMMFTSKFVTQLGVISFIVTPSGVISFIVTPSGVMSSAGQMMASGNL
ncbi:hypothetical protein J40TS1_11300 [Paenibacillus montaniterrae]|uniref:Uncharacterized protein n=1 Tax=Paenibacillus montaniterrae TaxID=429341 RepID=A0A920CXN2_9BACL|nr:hypothetical protein J40TS1_11300 [Paenibacillus montaniterrae]